MQNRTEPDFTQARQWNRDDVNYIDIDLSVARIKPELINLSGRILYVESDAFDDKYTLSSTKTVGNAILTLNEPDSAPLMLDAGRSYDFDSEFDRVFIRNSAQSGKMLRLICSVDTRIIPYSSEVLIGPTGTALPVVSAIKSLQAEGAFAVSNATATQILPGGGSTTQMAWVQNRGPNSIFMHSNSVVATVLAQGIELAAGDFMQIDGNISQRATCNPTETADIRVKRLGA